MTETNRTNRQWVLRARPKGEIDLSVCFQLKEAEVPSVPEGHVLAKTLWLSFDPTQRAWMQLDTYIPKVPIGEAMGATGIAQVIESKSSKYQVGDIVIGLCNWQEFVLFEPGKEEVIAFQKVPGTIDPVHMLAMAPTALTAYFGLLDVGKPKAGETLLVSGAAGATGSMVGQIGKLKGCRTVGIAGGPEKCQWLLEKGCFDFAIDYKNENVDERIQELCPDGVDVYFDNVGGEILDHALKNLAQNARVVLCGAISQYSKPSIEEWYGPKYFANLTMKGAMAKGFLIFEYEARYLEGILRLSDWNAKGKICFHMDVQEGFENIPTTLLRLYTGANRGKQILKVADPPVSAAGPSMTERVIMSILTFVYGLRRTT